MFPFRTSHIIASLTVHNSHITRVIAEGEHQRLDFKMRIDDARKIARTLVAFANTDGGRLLIGVKDNGRITGVDTEEEIHMIEAAASMYCRPEVAYEVKVWNIEGRSILDVYVHPSPLKPHSAGIEPEVWKPFLRRADQNFLVPGVLLEVWRGKESDRAQRYFHTEKEKRIFDAMNSSPDLSISQLIRNTRIPKPVMTKLLARFIRWGLVELFFANDQPRFRLK